jgi:hypothetical protein
MWRVGGAAKRVVNSELNKEVSNKAGRACHHVVALGLGPCSERGLDCADAVARMKVWSRRMMMQPWWMGVWRYMAANS